MIKYRLLVLDVDDTLLNDNREVTRATLSSLLMVQHMGVAIVLASGRPTYGLRPLAGRLEMDKYGGFIMSYNGGQIINMQTGELLFERRIDPQSLPYIESVARKNDLTIFTYFDDTIFASDASNERVAEEAARNNMRIVQADNFAAAVNFSPCKCMLTSPNVDALAALEKRLKQRLGGSLDVFRSEPYFLEIVPPSVNKADTLGVLMSKLSITPEEIIAIGNGVCDIGMIQMAGLGIAMGNAEESVKLCADHTTASNNDDGVARAVEDNIISGVRPTDIPLEEMNLRGRHSLTGNLGIQYTYASEGRIEATMPVDERTRQPFGILHGGATLALAETVAGFGSMILCMPDETMVGMQVSGNHVSSAGEGDTVRAVAEIVHKGRSSHVWNVDVFASAGKLVSTIRVVNSIRKKR